MALVEVLQEKLQRLASEVRFERGDVVVLLERENLVAALTTLKNDPELSFEMLVSVTAVDWLDSREARFDVVYHLLSLTRNHRVRVRVPVGEDDPSVESVASLWKSADFMERETWDMYGIQFLNHPDLRRILMYDEFQGYPLRKDYPVQGKQPRIKMRAPEVHNTARDMVRPPLVQINRRPLAGGQEKGVIDEQE